MKYDLHSHTRFSDGHLTPIQLIERAIEKGVDVLAITDHDTVAGYLDAQAHLAEHPRDITLISGVEISTKWHGFEVHIVGLNLDVTHPELTALLQSQQTKRLERAEKIAAKLSKCGFPDMLEAAKNLAGDGEITRAHFAEVLYNQGHVKSMQKAFDKFIGKGKGCYVASQWCEITTAIAAIKAAGGQAVLAHPTRYDLSKKWLRKLLAEFKTAGGDAIEVARPQQAPTERQHLGRLANEYQLLGSQGSDFHFPTNWLELGKNLYLPKDCDGIWQRF